MPNINDSFTNIGKKLVKLGIAFQNTNTKLSNLVKGCNELGLNLDIKIDQKQSKHSQDIFSVNKGISWRIEDIPIDRLFNPMIVDIFLKCSECNTLHQVLHSEEEIHCSNCDAVYCIKSLGGLITISKDKWLMHDTYNLNF